MNKLRILNNETQTQHNEELIRLDLTDVVWVETNSGV